jgi:hypothetical protein
MHLSYCILVAVCIEVSVIFTFTIYTTKFIVCSKKLFEMLDLLGKAAMRIWMAKMIHFINIQDSCPP